MTDPVTASAPPVVTVQRNPLLGWFADRRINTKILTAVAVVAVMGGGISAVALNRMSALNDDMNQVKEANVQRLSHLVDTRGSMADMFNATSALMAVQEADLRAGAAQQVKEFTGEVTAAFDAYKAQPSSTAGWKDTVVSFDEAWKNYQALRAVVIFGEKSSSGIQVGTDTAAILKQFADVSGQMNEAMDQLAVMERQDAEAMTVHTMEEYESARTLILMMLGLGLLLALGLAMVVSRLIVRPLSAVSGALGAVAGGDLTQKVEVASRDEVGQMAVAVNQANTSIRQ
ncbi:MCP four helix bundle domain-containing protein, partial [Planobispora takensis]|uniref:MCP four helix bundle domain-containing protein n=2 Tax=Planobispora takensis TaxID=1367882 RepID=UPI0035EA908F